MACVEWASETVKRGAGELLISSVDRDGTRRGFDTELVAAIAPNVSVPVTASGGLGSLGHLRSVLVDGKADAVAVGSALHYGKVTFEEMRAAAVEIRSLRNPLALLPHPGPGVPEIASPEKRPQALRNG